MEEELLVDADLFGWIIYLLEFHNKILKNRLYFVKAIIRVVPGIVCKMDKLCDDLVSPKRK